MIPSRRSFLFGAGSLLAAPSIVRVACLMPVSAAALDAPLIVTPLAPPAAPGIYTGAFEPQFVVQFGSLYLCTGASGGLYGNNGGTAWERVTIQLDSHEGT